MSFSYLNVSKQIALRAGQLADAADAATLATQWNTALSVNQTGMEIPRPALKPMILASERRIAGLIAKTKQWQYRAPLRSRTADLLPYDYIPVTDVSGKEILGIPGAVRDGENNKPLRERKQQVIRRFLEATYGFWKINPEAYCFVGTQIIHTVEAAYLEVCIWDETARSNAYDANGNSILPGEFETFLIADVLANMPQEEWFVNEAGIYSGIVGALEQQLDKGIPPRAFLPDTTANEDPVGN